MKTISQRMIRLTAASVIAGAFALPLWAGDVAKVNGQAIPESHLQAILDKQIEQGQKDTPELREAIREELVRRVAIEQAAKKQGSTKMRKSKRKWHWPSKACCCATISLNT
ncbi:hypothetical protein [Hydrogenophilus thermoluteolus]|uniref:hypothetical protein n=1 Tax=Hydrogenophilus thermoluteolus TaxID=297 RepID=UPI003F667398